MESGGTARSLSLRFIRMKLDACHTLLAKARYPFIRSSENGMSVPGTAIEDNVNRTASAPYCSTRRSGSITLPRVLLIFLRLASRTTFYIGRDGKVLYIDRDVHPASHGADVAAKLAELGVDRR